jgi:hypothetical protein
MAAHRIPLRFTIGTVSTSFAGAVAELVATEPVHQAVTETAARIARIARSTAVSSGLADATTVIDQPGKKDRAQQIVRVEHPAAARAEWGTSRTPGHHTLGRAVEAAGFERKGGDR